MHWLENYKIRSRRRLMMLHITIQGWFKTLLIYLQAQGHLDASILCSLGILEPGFFSFFLYRFHQNAKSRDFHALDCVFITWKGLLEMQMPRLHPSMLTQESLVVVCCGQAEPVFWALSLNLTDKGRSCAPGKDSRVFTPTSLPLKAKSED